MPRLEVEPEWIPYDPVTIGHAEGGHGESAAPVAVLWVPDPEQRHGWREAYIYPVEKPRPPVGFRKPGERR